MAIFKIKDSRGKESITLGFVLITWLVVIFKFIFAGLNVPLLGVLPAMGGVEFAAAIAAVLGIWTAREHIEKTYED